MRRLFAGLGIAILAALTVGTAAAQPLPVRLYGADLSERALALVEGVDPGFCIAGWTWSLGSRTSSDILVIKTDAQGIPQWTDISFGPDDEEAHSMVRSTDNCYVVTGWTESYGIGIPNRNIFVLKLDQAGNMVWGNVYGGWLDDEGLSIVETSDGGYAITGLTHSFGPQPHPNIFVLKLTKQGFVQWMRVYWMAPNHIEDEGFSIVETPDSGFAVVGRAKTVHPGLFDPFVLKLDWAGNPVWLLTSPGALGDDEAHSVAIDLRGDICVAGFTRSFGTNPSVNDDIFMAQFNLAGSVLSSHTYGWSWGDEQVLDDRSLARTSDRGTVLCGPTTSVGPGIPNPNFLILKLDSLGLPMWCRSHPSPYDPGLLSDVPLPMIELQQGGYAIAGWTNSYPHLGGGDDVHLATLDPTGNRPVCVEPQEPEVESMPWIRWYVEDEYCEPEIEEIWLEPIDIPFDSICYDTIGTGVRQEGQVPGKKQSEFSLRAVGSKVELNLAQPAVLEVQVFTSDGRQVARFGRQQFAAGRHELVLPERIASGAYLVCVTGGGRSESAKVVKF